MVYFNEIVEELTALGMTEERANTLIVKLLTAGQQSVFASLGEMHGVPSITRAQLGLLIARLIATSRKDKTTMLEGLVLESNDT